MPLPHRIEQAGFPSCVHLGIQFNQHAVYYQTAEEWLADQDDGSDRCWFDWVSDEERQKALASGRVWTCQWYQDTPVGFSALAASSFEALMAAVNQG